MDWSDTPEQSEFRARVRSVIGEKLPERYRGRGRSVSWQRDRKSEDPAVREAAMGWNRALGEHGWLRTGRRSTAARG